jgi:hypothetical protein
VVADEAAAPADAPPGHDSPSLRICDNGDLEVAEALDRPRQDRHMLAPLAGDDAGHDEGVAGPCHMPHVLHLTEMMQALGASFPHLARALAAHGTSHGAQLVRSGSVVSSLDGREHGVGGAVSTAGAPPSAASTPPLVPASHSGDGKQGGGTGRDVDGGEALSQASLDSILQGQEKSVASEDEGMQCGQYTLHPARLIKQQLTWMHARSAAPTPPCCKSVRHATQVRRADLGPRGVWGDSDAGQEAGPAGPAAAPPLPSDTMAWLRSRARARLEGSRSLARAIAAKPRCKDGQEGEGRAAPAGGSAGGGWRRAGRLAGAGGGCSSPRGLGGPDAAADSAALAALAGAPRATCAQQAAGDDVGAGEDKESSEDDKTEDGAEDRGGQDGDVKQQRIDWYTSGGTTGLTAPISQLEVQARTALLEVSSATTAWASRHKPEAAPARRPPSRALKDERRADSAAAAQHGAAGKPYRFAQADAMASLPSHRPAPEALRLNLSLERVASTGRKHSSAGVASPRGILLSPALAAAISPRTVRVSFSPRGSAVQGAPSPGLPPWR